MNITLPAEQERWLEKRIANGEFQSAEDAVRQLIGERMIVDDDDMAWARPHFGNPALGLLQMVS